MSDNYYKYKRFDLLGYFPERKFESLLDIGCGEGEFGFLAKKKFNINYVEGVEINNEVALKASLKLDKVFIGDITEYLKKSSNINKFDVIVFGDVLEHLIDPWLVLKQIKKILSENGIVIASIPNLSIDAIKYIIFDKWLYTDAGLLDRTHLRFFTRATIYEMFESAGYTIIKEGTENYNGIKERMLKPFLPPKLKLLWNGKYYITAKINKTNSE